MKNNRFNPYTYAIAATEKAIASRKNKITQQQDLEAIFMSEEKRASLYHEIGRAQAECDFLRGAEKKKAESRLASLEEKAKKVDESFSERSTNLLFKYEDELSKLTKSLLELKQLHIRYEKYHHPRLI